MCIVSAAVTESGDIKMSAWWCFMSWILDLWSRRIVAASVCLWPGGQLRRIQLQKAQFEPWEGRTIISYFCHCGVITVDLVNLLFKRSDGIGGRPNWAMYRDI